MFRHWISTALCSGILLVTAGCGGGGSPPPPATPAVTISVSPSAITAGQNSTLTWSSTDATSCTASGAWTGSRATSGNQTIIQPPAGSYTYTLTCTGSGGNTSNSATLTVGAGPLTWDQGNWNERTWN